MKTFKQFMAENLKPVVHTYGWETKKVSDGYEWNVHKFHLEKKEREYLHTGKEESREGAIAKAKSEFKKYDKK